jgi:hypothetical protein
MGMTSFSWRRARRRGDILMPAALAACWLLAAPAGAQEPAGTNAVATAERPRVAKPRPPGVVPPAPETFTAKERAAWEARWALLLERIKLKRSLATATPAEREAALESWERQSAPRAEQVAQLEKEGALERAAVVKAEREAAARAAAGP